MTCFRFSGSVIAGKVQFSGMLDSGPLDGKDHEEIEVQTRASAYFGGVPKAIFCDNLKAGVAKALWFEPTLNQAFAAVAEHYDTTISPTRSR